jgi:hypothetical protein
MLRLQSLFVCVLTALSASPCLAQGGVQLNLEGAAGPHGALLELEVTALDTRLPEPRAVQTDLSVYVAPRTSSLAALALLNARLQAQGIATVYPLSEKGPASLFVLDATRVRMRAGHGFDLTLTTCEGPPAWIRLERAAQIRSVSKIRVVAFGRSPVDGRTQSGLLNLDLDGKANSPSVSNALRKQASALGWLSDRPELNSWRPLKVGEGLYVVGCSVSVSGADPWWLDIGL